MLHKKMTKLAVRMMEMCFSSVRPNSSVERNPGSREYIFRESSNRNFWVEYS